MHGDADVMGKLRINQHEMLEISITKVSSQLSFGKELSLGKAVGCQIGERHPIGCTERKVDSPSSRAIVEAGETSFSLDPSSSSAVTLPVELWLFLEGVFSARLRLSSGKMQKASLVFSASPSSSMPVALSKKEIKLGWHDWFLTNPCSLILFIILHLTSCSLKSFFQPLSGNSD